MKNFLTEQQQAERRKDVELYLSMRKTGPNTSHQVAKVLVEWEGYQSRKTPLKMNKKLQRAGKMSSEKTSGIPQVKQLLAEELPSVQQVFMHSKEKFQLGIIDEATAMKLSSQAKAIVQQAMQEWPEGIKNRVVIKNIGIDIPKSRLLQKKMSSLTTSASESNKKAKALIEDLWKAVEQEMGVLLPWKTKPIRWISKFVPLIGSKLENHMLDQERISSFIEGVQEGLDKATKELKDQVAELSTQQDFLRADAKKLLEDFYLVQFIGQEIEWEIQNMITGDESEDIVLYKDEINKNLLTPVLQKALAIGERIATDYNYYSVLTLIQHTAGNLIIEIQKADQVTMHALQNALTAQIAILRQQEIQNGIDKLNNITWELLRHTAETLGKQSKEVAENTLKTSLNMEDLKASMESIRKSIAEVNQVYENALPEFNKNIEELQTIIAEGDKMLDASEQALQLKKPLISE